MSSDKLPTALPEAATLSIADLAKDPFVLDRMTPSGGGEGSPRLYSNLDWKDTVGPWGQSIRYVPPPALMGPGLPVLGTLAHALRLLWVSRDRQAVGLLRAHDRSALLFCFLRSILFRSRGVVVLFGFFVSPSSRPKRWFLRRAVLGSALCVTWSRKQIANYAQELGVPSCRFLFLPYKTNHSAEGERPSSTIGDYLFSGGNSERDYGTLFEAVRNTGIPVIVSRTKSQVTAGLSIPDNVIVLEATEPHFARLMAGGRVVVVCLRKDLLRGAGEATFLNAMWHRRPTIVADDISAADYIDDGVTGYVVPAGDVAALRRRILEVWQHPDKAAAVGEAGFEKVRQLYTHDRWKDRILKLAHVVYHDGERG